MKDHCFLIVTKYKNGYHYRTESSEKDATWEALRRSYARITATCKGLPENAEGYVTCILKVDANGSTVPCKLLADGLDVHLVPAEISPKKTEMMLDEGHMITVPTVQYSTPQCEMGDCYLVVTKDDEENCYRFEVAINKKDAIDHVLAVLRRKNRDNRCESLYAILHVSNGVAIKYRLRINKHHEVKLYHDWDF